MKKNSTIILTIAFLTCLILPLVFLNREEGKISETENRFLASFPEPFTKKGFEDWINDNIGFRNEFTGIYANIMYHILGLSPSEKIVIGNDGWLFYNGDNNMRIADGTYPLTEENLNDIVKGQQEIRDYLKTKNCEYCLILPPSKVSVYYKYLKGNYEIKDTPADIVERELNDKTDVEVINLKPVLLKAKEKDKIFLKTDTHWNQLGAYVAYKEIHNRLLPGQDEPDVEIYETTVKGEFSNMMGSSGLLKDEETKATRITAPDAELISETGGREFKYHNDNGNGKICLMFGDSLFGADWNIKELLAEDFTDFIFVWSYDIDVEKIEKYSPDIVLYDMGERFLNILGENCRL